MADTVITLRIQSETLAKLEVLEDEHPVASRYTIGNAAFSLGIGLMASSKEGAYDAILREVRSRAKNRKEKRGQRKPPPVVSPTLEVVPGTATVVSPRRARKTRKKPEEATDGQEKRPVEEGLAVLPESPEAVEEQKIEENDAPQSEEKDLWDDILESL
jgi:hypothetical protein